MHYRRGIYDTLCKNMVHNGLGIEYLEIVQSVSGNSDFFQKVSAKTRYHKVRKMQ